MAELVVERFICHPESMGAKRRAGKMGGAELRAQKVDMSAKDCLDFIIDWSQLSHWGRAPSLKPMVARGWQQNC